MKITYQGFRLHAGDGMTMADFCGLLIQKSSDTHEYHFNDHNRLFLFEEEQDADYYTGLLITTKDQRSFCELRNEKGKLSISRSELDENAQLMDFNFFVLNKKTYAGVYQHYHASCSPPQFGVFLREHFWKPESHARRISHEKELQVVEGLSAEAAGKKAAKKFRRHLTSSMLYKPDDFATILKAMKQIRKFRYQIETAKSEARKFTPGIDLKRVYQEVSFADTDRVGQIVDSISSFVKELGIKRGKVTVFDDEGEERNVYLEKNIEGFGEFDFDEVTEEIELDLESFVDSPVITSLLATAREHNDLFGK